MIVSSVALAADIAPAMKRVEAIRHQTFRKAVLQKTISRDEMMAFLQERLKTDLPLSPDRYVAVLRALQVIPATDQALVEHKLDQEPNWVCLGDPADSRFVRSLTAGRLADAFICANDDTAARLMRALELAGMKVPRRCARGGL